MALWGKFFLIMHTKKGIFMKKFTAFIILTAFIASLFAFSPVLAADSYFTDVASNTTLCDAVNKLFTAKIILGYGDLTFRPNNPITRAELCKIVNMVFGYTAKDQNTFADVSQSDWYYDYVLTAKKAGYIKGFEDSTFRGDDYLSREQFCAILNRTAKPFELPFDKQITDEISDWAKDDVYKIVSNYLMPLEANNTFRATQNITRAEVSLVLAKFVADTPVTPSEPATPSTPSTGGNTGGSSGSGNKGNSGGGNKGNSGGNNGGNSGGKKDDTKPDYTNEQIVDTLKSLISQLGNIRFTADENKVITEIKTAVNLAIESGEKGTEITREYVKTTYKDYIDKARSYKSEMGEDAFSELKAKLVRELDTQTVNILNDYFISEN